MRNLLTAFPPLIAHCIFHCIFNISTVKPHEFVKFVSVRLFFALYVVDPHQDFYMRFAMRISAYADHPHEPHGSATAWPSLVSRPLRPKWAVPHPIISQNMRFYNRKKLWTIPLMMCHFWSLIVHFLHFSLDPTRRSKNYAIRNAANHNILTCCF